MIAEANENTLPTRRRGAHAAPEAAAADPSQEPAAPDPAAPDLTDAAEPVLPAEPVTPVTLAEALAAPPEAGLPSPDEVFTAAPAVDAPPADHVFTAAPAAEASPADVPPADQVVTAEPPAGEQLLARIVHDTDPADFTLPDPAEANPAEPPAGGPADQTFTAEPPAGDHAHTPAEADWLPRQGSHPADPADGGGPVTDKGLPKRTPRTVAAPRREDVRPQPPRRVDAEELRRRLGGFYQGAQDGRRVVAAEFAQDLEQGPGQGQSNTDQGDSAQEART